MRYSCRPQQHLLCHLFSLAFLWELPWLYSILPQPGCRRKRRRGIRMLIGTIDRLRVCSEELRSCCCCCCCCDKMAQSILSQSWKLEIQNQRQQDCAPLTYALGRIIPCLFLDAVVPINPFSCIPPILTSTFYSIISSTSPTPGEGCFTSYSLSVIFDEGPF